MLAFALIVIFVSSSTIQYKNHVKARYILKEHIPVTVFTDENIQ